MSLSLSTKLSERLTPAKIRELAELIVKSERPQPTSAIVTPLLELLVGGKFDVGENLLIREPSVLLLLVELLPHLSEEIQLELWSRVNDILYSSLWNIHSCRHLLLIDNCLLYLQKTNSIKVATQLVKVIEMLGTYSVSVKQLKGILSYLYATQVWAPHSVLLIESLYNILLSGQPDAFFNFSGAQGAALTLPPISKWPIQSGFSFSTWLRIEEPFDISQRDYYKPVIYWFRTGKGYGFSAHFIGNTLVLETAGRGSHKKPQTHPLSTSFQPYQWYMLTVTYDYHRLRSSELGCYVNGQHVLSSEVAMPTTDDIYDKCFLGSSPSATPDATFQGQMTAVYLFKERLTRDTVTALYQLGPGYKNQFKFDAETNVPLKDHERKLLFDGHLSEAVLFSYNAKAVDGQLCLESSPIENPSPFIHSPHATLLEGVEPVVTNSLESALHSLGGVQVLYPLFAQLDLPQSAARGPQSGVNYQLCTKLLSLVFELSKSSTSFMHQMTHNRALSLIHYLLEKVDHRHLSIDVVTCIFNFTRYLSESSHGVDLLYQLIEHFVLCPGLWIIADTHVQIQFYSQLAAEFCVGPLGSSGVVLRDKAAVEQLLFSLREYYSLTGAEEGAAEREKRVKVRSYILLVVKQFITTDKGIREGEMQSILNYLSTVPEEVNLLDVVELLVALLFEDTSGNIVPMFERLGGLNLTAKLLACLSEEITLYALKMIGKVLQHSQSKHQQQLLHTTHILAVVREKLLSSRQPVTTAMFNTLFEVLVNCPSRKIISGHYIALDLSHSIHFPDMLAVVIELVCLLHTSPSGWQEGDTLIRVHLFSYITSLCAQSHFNCKALLRLKQWQYWLLVLADQRDANESDYESLQQLLYQLFHSLLLHCFQEEQDGWRVWLETMATIHAYLSTGKRPLSTTSTHAVGSRDTSCATTPSSSVEGIREAMTSNRALVSDTILQHQLATAITAETRSHDERGPVIVEKGGGDVGGEGDGGHPLSVESRDTETERPSERIEVEVKAVETPQEISSPSSSSSQSNTPLARHRVFQPPPLATPLATPPITPTERTPSCASSSNDSPTSPFFIPSHPFLSVGGHVPRFQWGTAHIHLLDKLLKSLLKIVEKWTTANRLPSRSLAEDSKLLRSNIAHLLAMICDVLVELHGGVKQLLLKSANTSLSNTLKLPDSLKKSVGETLKSSLASNRTMVRPILVSALRLSEVMVMSGSLKLGVVETKMKMEHGGMQRQALRLVLAEACLNTMETNVRNKEYHRHYQKMKKRIERDYHKAVALLGSLDIADSSLEKYFKDSMEGRTAHLQESQCLLSSDSLSLLTKLLDRDWEGREVQDPIVRAVVYYLVVLCVAKYRSILESVGKDKLGEDTTSEPSSPAQGGLDGGGKQNQMSGEGDRNFGPPGGRRVEEKKDNKNMTTNDDQLSGEGGRNFGPPGEGSRNVEESRKDENLTASDATSDVRGIQRPQSVSSDYSTTPDLDQAFHFPTPEEGAMAGRGGEGEQSMPVSVTFYRQSMDTSEQIELALKLVGPFLCQLLVSHRAALSRLLVGSDGRPLLTDAVCRVAENQSLVEITMLLCSQEWQASLAKHGRKSFTDILTEGKNMVHFCANTLSGTASRAVADLKANSESQIQHFTKFEEQLSVYLSQAVRESSETSQLRRAEWKRDTMYARELWRKVSSVVDEYGKFDRNPLRCKFWKMDLRENSQRQRVKLVANTHGSLHEDARRTAGEPEEGGGVGEEGVHPMGVPLQSGSPVMSSQVEVGSLSSDELLESQLNEQEQARQLWSVPCMMLVMAHTLPGKLIFTPFTLSFNADDDSDEFNKLSHLSDYYAMNERWTLSDVKAVFSRRYLHQKKALEIFFTNRSSVFLVFSSHGDVRDVVKILPKVGIGAEYELPQTRSISLAPPHQLFRKSSMTAKWQRREISNFDYLIYLNTIAGRTYNDLNQYPVFPWVLSDYTSEILDLDDPTVYRDLTKPVGALNSQRLSRLEERLEAWEDDRIPPFLYGTHYSTMAFVLHWMVRVEPFTTAHIQFHDGVFDQGSRMFTSVQQSWNNVCSDSASVKELIPELFYLPEMLTNHNKFYLGREGACEEGDLIGDVVLPTWADSAREFTHLHREALESEYVSSNLHHWIDLIFGFKQKGEEAVKAKNTFYYLTYTGCVDLDAITDPHLRKGLEDQIRHFGQTPSQLLTDPHPAREPAVKENPPPPLQGVFPHDPAVVAELQISPDVPIALVQLSSPPHPSSTTTTSSATTTTNSVLVITYNQLYTVNKWTVIQGKSNSSQVHLEPDPRIGSSGLKVRLGDPLDQTLSPSSACFAALPGNDVIFVCGFWDNSFKSFNTDTGASIQSIFGHREIVTCISYSGERGVWSAPGSGLLVTGSHDATVLVWRWCGRQRRVVGSFTGLQNRAGSVTPEAILTGHVESVVCVDVSASLGLIVSGAKYGHCLVHSTGGELLHKLASACNWSFPHLIALTNRGHIVVHYADQKGCIGVFSCNGQQFAQCALGDPALAMTVSRCGRYLVAGGFDCKVRVFLCHSLERNYVYEAFNSSIRSLHFSHNQRYIFAGLASGSVAVLATHYWLDL